jgi:hypothetical protein
LSLTKPWFAFLSPGGCSSNHGQQGARRPSLRAPRGTRGRASCGTSAVWELSAAISGVAGFLPLYQICQGPFPPSCVERTLSEPQRHLRGGAASRSSRPGLGLRGRTLVCAPRGGAAGGPSWVETRPGVLLRLEPGPEPRTTNPEPHGGSRAGQGCASLLKGNHRTQVTSESRQVPPGRGQGGRASGRGDEGDCAKSRGWYLSQE